MQIENPLDFPQQFIGRGVDQRQIQARDKSQYRQDRNAPEPVRTSSVGCGEGIGFRCSVDEILSYPTA